MKKAYVFILGAFAGMVGISLYDAYEPPIEFQEPVVQEAEEGSYGAEYSFINDNRKYEIKTAHDFIITVMAEDQKRVQKNSFYEKFGIRGFISNYYRRRSHRRTKFFDREDVLKNKQNVIDAVNNAYKMIEESPVY